MEAQTKLNQEIGMEDNTKKELIEKVPGEYSVYFSTDHDEWTKHEIYNMWYRSQVEGQFLEIDTPEYTRPDGTKSKSNPRANIYEHDYNKVARIKISNDFLKQVFGDMPKDTMVRVVQENGYLTCYEQDSDGEWHEIKTSYSSKSNSKYDLSVLKENFQKMRQTTPTVNSTLEASDEEEHASETSSSKLEPEPVDWENMKFEEIPVDEEELESDLLQEYKRRKDIVVNKFEELLDAFEFMNQPL